jgi:hypothetical protein
MNAAPGTTEDILVTIATPNGLYCFIVKTLAKEASFSIYYTVQEHAGKHTAVNRGVSLARVS